MLAPIFGYSQLVARDVEGGPLPAIGRLDLVEPVTTVGLKTQNIVARAVAIHVGDPTDAFGQIGSTRSPYPPGSWEWLLKFRQKASPRLGALALLMFVTGARIGQAFFMHPRKHINKAKGMVCIPGAKGHGDRGLRVPDEVMAELTALPEIYPRDWPRKPENLRLFGYAGSSGPIKLWNKACEAAGIEQISFHPVGRYGFCQEMNVREKVDEKAAGAFGGWSDLNLMRNTYTHAEDTETKINEALRRGLVKAEIKTKLKLRKEP